MYYLVAILILIVICVAVAYLCRDVIKTSEATTKLVLIVVVLLGVIAILTGFPIPIPRR